jgi:hypothetical protein
MTKLSNVDEYALDLLNKAKRFYEKGKQEADEIAISSYFQSSIIFSIMSLETIVFSISEELCIRENLSLLEKSLLLEKTIIFDSGIYSLSNKLKMSKLTDKINFLLIRFNSNFDKNKLSWWPHLIEGIRLRNDLIHPKIFPVIASTNVENTIISVLECTDALYRAIYKKRYPHFNKKLTTTYNF